MLKNRLIAVILVSEGTVVQSVQFKHTNVIHYDPVHAIESFYTWSIDEIVILNVSKDKSSSKSFFEIIHRISEKCFVPFAIGGWIENMETAKLAFNQGADKIILNTQPFLNPQLITTLSLKYGSQCVIISIDSKKNSDGIEKVVIDRGRQETNMSTVDWAIKAAEMGAGELFINSIPHDGNRKGFNLELFREISEKVSIPLIGMGGVFNWEHLVEGINKGKADAVAAANIFHYTELSIKNAKKYLVESGLNFRKVE